MTTASTDRELAGTIFVAINRALEAEGYSNSEAFRIADRGARLLAAPETPVLEAALRAADATRIPPKIKQTFDRIDCAFDKIQAEFRRAFWILGGLLVAVVAYLAFLLVTAREL